MPKEETIQWLILDAQRANLNSILQDDPEFPRAGYLPPMKLNNLEEL